MEEARYEIAKLLGKGRTGGVYEAEDLNLQRKVAMRRFFDQGNKVDFSDHKEKFIEVAQSLGNIQHPNIIQVFDAGMDEDGAYVISQLLDGESLHEEIKRGALEISMVVDIAKQLLDGFIAAHDQNYFHGALTPGSIFMTVSTRGGFSYIITDMGLARLAPLIQGEGTLLAFMADQAILAPELFEGGESSAQADLYMLGHILYMCLAGGHPFGGLNIEEAKAKHQEGLPDIKKYCGDLSQSLKAWLSKMTAPNLADRPASAIEALNELNSIQPGTVLPVSEAGHGAQLIQGDGTVNFTSPNEMGADYKPGAPRLATSPVPITAPGTEPLGVVAPGANSGADPYSMPALGAESLVEAAPVTRPPGTRALVIPPPGTGPLGISPTGTGPMGIVPKETGMGVSSYAQQASLQQPHVDQSMYVPRKKSFAGLFIGLVAVVLVAAVVFFAMSGSEDKGDDRGDKSEVGLDKGTSSDLGAGRTSGASNTPEKIALFDVSSPANAGWLLRSPASQAVKNGGWLIRDKSPRATSGARFSLGSVINKMFDQGWRITYQVRVLKGYNKFGFVISDKMNPGWMGKGSLGCYIVVNSVPGKSMVYTPQKDPWTWKKGKVYTKEHVNGNGWVNITIEQKANRSDGYYTVKVDGVPAYTDTFEEGFVLEAHDELNDHLFTYSLGKRDKSEWIIQKFTLEAF